MACLTLDFFFVALGLTLIFGVMGILNVARGSLYAFSGYMAATLVLWATGLAQPPALVLVAALLASALAMGGILGRPWRSGCCAVFRTKTLFCSSLYSLGSFVRSSERAATDLGNCAVFSEQGGQSTRNYRTFFDHIYQLSAAVYPRHSSYLFTVCCSIFSIYQDWLTQIYALYSQR